MNRSPLDRFLVAVFVAFVLAFLAAIFYIGMRAAS
jgi:hypothetical protein